MDSRIHTRFPGWIAESIAGGAVSCALDSGIHPGNSVESGESGGAGGVERAAGSSQTGDR